MTADHVESAAAEELYVGDCLVRPARGEVIRDGEVFRIEPKVADLLLCLAGKPGQVIGKDELHRTVWAGTFVSDHVLTHSVWQLRHAFGDRKIIETIPKRGYRLTASVRYGAAEPAIQQAPPRQTSHRVRRWAWVTIVLMCAGGAGSWFMRPSAALDVKSVAVLPLANYSSDPEQQYFADGMTEEITADLSKIAALRVISRTSAMKYKNTVKTLPEIGVELGIDAVIEGSVHRAGPRVRISLQLVVCKTERHVWAETYEGNATEALAMRRQIAQAVAAQVRIKLTPQDRARLPRGGTIDQEAYEAFLRGRYFLSRREYAKGVSELEKAVRKDSNYALAYAYLADAYGMMNVSLGYRNPEYFRRRSAAGQRALELDDQLAEAHIFLGDRLFYLEWRWRAGEAEYRRAVGLDGGSAEAHAHLATALCAMRRFDEALREMESARTLDPLSPTINLSLASMLRDTGNLQAAGDQVRKAIELNPDDRGAYALLALIQEDMGRTAEALANHLREEQLAGVPADQIVVLQRIAGSEGLQSYWKYVANKLMQQAKTNRVSPVRLAAVEARLGDNRRALQLLEQAYQDRHPELYALNSSANWVSLHREPGFQALLERMQFPNREN